MDDEDAIARTFLALERSRFRLQNSMHCLRVTQDRVAATQRDLEATWEIAQARPRLDLAF
jgi:hypothetical protein